MAAAKAATRRAGFRVSPILGATAGTSLAPAPRRGGGSQSRASAKIVQVAVTIARSGTEQIILDLSERFVADGAVVTIVIPTGAEALDRMADEARERGCSVERVGPLYPGDRDKAANLRSLYGLFRRLRPSIVHYHIPRAFSGFESIAAAYLARVSRRIRTDQNPVVYLPSRAELGRLRLADSMVHRIALVSTDNLENHLQRCGRPAKKCAVIPNGVDVHTIVAHQGPGHSGQMRRRLGLPTDVPIAVMVGTLGERKGALDYISAARTASTIVPRLNYAVIGDGEALRRMREMAVEFEIGDRVHFLGRRPDVRQILPAFDFFVLPSHYEGMALTMLEALASGLPMATTRVDGVSDVLPGEHGALFVNKHDTEALGVAMARLATDPCLARELAAIARDRVRRLFDIETVYSRYRELYGQLGVFHS